MRWWILYCDSCRNTWIAETIIGNGEFIDRDTTVEAAWEANYYHTVNRLGQTINNVGRFFVAEEAELKYFLTDRELRQMIKDGI